MKTIALLLTATLLTAGTAAAAPAGRETDLGVILGEPVGGTAEMWLDGRTSVDFGAGLSDGNGAFWGDLLVHDWAVLRQPKQGRLCAYLGLGPQVRSGDDARFGVRTIAGLLYRPQERPLEFFFEAGPLFRVTQGGRVDAVGGVGLRVRLGAASEPR
jgi:hypothetical protein